MTWHIVGKNVIVTGGNSGIGLATATELARQGARVTIAARDVAKGEAAVAAVREASGADAGLRILDLADLASVHRFAEEYRAGHGHLDVLINNAGVMAGGRRVTVDGFEWTFAVNHLGHFLLTNLLAPLLEAGPEGRVINVSSEVHHSAKAGLDFDDLQMTRGYSPGKPYRAAKLANILFTVEFNRRFADRTVTARAAHPGLVGTNFGTGADSPWWMGVGMRLLRRFFKPPAEGARTSIHLATADEAELGTTIYWADAEPKEPSPAALDVDAAARLWVESERMVGLA